MEPPCSICAEGGPFREVTSQEKSRLNPFVVARVSNVIVGDYTSGWVAESGSTVVHSLPKPALKHARTKLQSDSESRPIRRTSRRNSITGNNLKYEG